MTGYLRLFSLLAVFFVFDAVLPSAEACDDPIICPNQSGRLNPGQGERIRELASGRDEINDLSKLFGDCLYSKQEFADHLDYCKIVQVTDAVCSGGWVEDLFRRSNEFSRLRQRLANAAEGGSRRSLQNKVSQTRKSLLRDVCDCKNDIEQHYINLKSEIGPFNELEEEYKKKDIEKIISENERPGRQEIINKARNLRVRFSYLKSLHESCFNRRMGEAGTEVWPPSAPKPCVAGSYTKQFSKVARAAGNCANLKTAHEGYKSALAEWDKESKRALAGRSSLGSKNCPADLKSLLRGTAPQDLGPFKGCERDLSAARACCDGLDCEADSRLQSEVNAHIRSEESIRSACGGAGSGSEAMASLKESRAGICEAAGKNICELDCQDRIKKFKAKFKKCFSPSGNKSIDDILKEANQAAKQGPRPEALKVADEYKTLLNKFYQERRAAGENWPPRGDISLSENSSWEHLPMNCSGIRADESSQAAALKKVCQSYYPGGPGAVSGFQPFAASGAYNAPPAAYNAGNNYAGDGYARQPSETQNNSSSGSGGNIESSDGWRPPTGSGSPLSTIEYSIPGLKGTYGSPSSRGLPKEKKEGYSRDRDREKFSSGEFSGGEDFSGSGGVSPDGGKAVLSGATGATGAAGSGAALKPAWPGFEGSSEDDPSKAKAETTLLSKLGGALKSRVSSLAGAARQKLKSILTDWDAKFWNDADKKASGEEELMTEEQRKFQLKPPTPEENIFQRHSRLFQIHCRRLGFPECVSGPAAIPKYIPPSYSPPRQLSSPQRQPYNQLPGAPSPSYNPPNQPYGAPY